MTPNGTGEQNCACAASGTCQLQCGTYSCNCTSCNCVSCNCTSCNCTYTNNYYVYLDSCVAGSVTQVSTHNIGGSGAATTLRAVANGTTLTCYAGGTQFYSGTQSALANQTYHGIGRGLSSGASFDSSAIDNLSVTILG